MNSNSARQCYDLFDLVKLIMSIMIIAIHSSLFTMYLYPWLRIAIPIFFVISSYLFFSKISRQQDLQEQKASLKKFASKNLRLWLIWSLILLPVVIYIRRNFYDDGIIGFLKLIKSIFFGGTFVGGWFIIALVEGVAIIYFLSKRMKTVYIMLISLLLNLLSVFESSYVALLDSSSVVSKAISIFDEALTTPAYSVICGLLWIAIGKLFAEGKINLKLKWSVLIALISAIGLYVEWLALYRLTSFHKNDCYIFLIPLCISLFAIIEKFKEVKIPNARLLRKASTVIYVAHGAVISVSSFVLRRVFENVYSVIVFLLTFVACFTFTLIINKLEKRFSWLKNLY